MYTGTQYSVKDVDTKEREKSDDKRSLPFFLPFFLSFYRQRFFFFLQTYFPTQPKQQIALTDKRHHHQRSHLALSLSLHLFSSLRLCIVTMALRRAAVNAAVRVRLPSVRLSTANNASQQYVFLFFHKTAISAGRCNTPLSLSIEVSLLLLLMVSFVL